MKKVLFTILGIIGFGSIANASNNPQPITNSTAVTVSSVSVAGAPATVTISSPTGSGAFSTGFFTYLAHVHIEAVDTGGLASNAGTMVTCVTTGLTNNQTYEFSAPVTTGTVFLTDVDFSNPIQATQGAQVTLGCTATARMLWNVQTSFIQGN